MSVARVLPRSLGCRSCQQHLLRSFVSTFVPGAVPSTFSAQSTAQSLQTISRRRVSTTTSSPSSNNQSNGLSETPAISGTLIEQENRTPDDAGQETKLTITSQSSRSSVPWYLQADEDVQTTTNAVSERQRLPEMPPNPPPILDSLLRYVSIDLGIDHLSLLDLRRLDPPSAFGNNLIMIFGSARSTKHLNVSADRLCRWLRTYYKLTPIADGLLGRNELKLKLRRKARRAKMITAAGVTAKFGGDDGITTGWVCVDAGMVEDGSKAKEDDVPLYDPGFIGFGDDRNEARIVVQMLTEERRAELDLERLWQENLDRFTRRQLGMLRTIEKDTAAFSPDGLTDQSLHRDPPAPQTIPARRSQTASRRQPAPATRKSLHPTFTIPALEEQLKRRLHTSVTRLQQDTSPESNNTSLASKDVSGTEDNLSSRLDTQKRPTYSLQQSDSDDLRLRTNMEYLSNLQRDVAVEALGIGDHDTDSTPFLRSVFEAFPSVFEAKHWHTALTLHCYALTIGHSGYTLGRLQELFREMMAALDHVPEQTFLLVLKSTLIVETKVESTGNTKAAAEVNYPSRRQVLAFAFEVMEKMDSYGYSILTDDILTLLHKAGFPPHSQDSNPSVDFSANNATENTLNEPAESGATEKTRLLAEQQSSNETSYSDALYTRKLQNQFRVLLTQLQYRPRSDKLFLTMLESYVQQHDWQSFWALWRTMPQIMWPRSAALYAFMFRSVANTGNIAHCERVLIRCTSAMELESSAVRIEDDLADAVRECLTVAEAPLNVHPFDKLWQRVGPRT